MMEGGTPEGRERRTLLFVGLAIVIIFVIGVIIYASLNSARAQDAPILPGPAQVCRTFDWFAKGLQEKYGEELVFQGINSKGNIVTIFASPSRSWTHVITLPSGCTKSFDSGDDIEAVRPPPPGRDS